jgi:hypothetical protein
MNDTFDIKRFAIVFKKLIFERSLQLLGSFVLFIIFTWVMYHISGNLSEGWRNAQLQTLLLGLLFGSVYWTSVGFSYFSDKAEGYGFLSLPASHVEKWLSVLALSIIYLISFCLFFSVLDASYTSYYHNHLNPKAQNYKDLYEAMQMLPLWGETKEDVAFCYIVFAVFSGTMAVGAVYFNKMAMVKTMFIFAGIIFTIQFLNSQIASALFQDDVHTNFFWKNIWVVKAQKTIDMPQNINQILKIGFSYVLPIALWLIALLRLREKEI